MIILNGVKFAANKQEFTNSLFQQGGTCSGYYRANLKSISLMNAQREKVGVINRAGVLGKAQKVRGQYYYTYGDIELLGKYEYGNQVRECTEIADKFLKKLN